MKRCYECEEDQDEVNFNKNSTKKDGLQGLCKKCEKLYHQEHYSKNKEAYITNSRNAKRKVRKEYSEWKETQVCAICPENDSICIDLHHLDSSKKDFVISETVGDGKSWKTILKEIEKCVPLCANCHRKVHKYGFEVVKQRRGGSIG